MPTDLSPRAGEPHAPPLSLPHDTTKVLPSAPQKVRVAWPHVVLGALGIAAGAVAVYEHALVMAGKATGCGATETISCDKVLGSDYGAVFGIPLGVYGMLFWAIVLLLSVEGKGTSPRSATWQRFAVASVGLGSSLVLAYVSLVVIGKFCPVCATTHVLSGLNFLVAAWSVWKGRL